MNNYSASSKVGGHITLLFSIHSSNQKNFEEQGSRGAGICIEKGVTVDAIAKKGNGVVTVFSKEKNISTELYIQVIKQISLLELNVNDFDWEFTIKSDLPFGQGFGCSAAGSLAATICVLKILNEVSSLTTALTVAHRVERILSAGLGDVSALGAGGIELRLEPGLPLLGKNGFVISWEADFPMLLCWINEKEKHTSEYIDDSKWKVKISLAGESCVSKLKQGDWTESAWEELLKQSKLFSINSGLIEDANRKTMVDKIKKVLNKLQLNEILSVRLCMLGSSAVVLPTNIHKVNIEDFKQLLSELKSIGLDGCLTTVCSNPIR
mgnify:CR=1 FL=1|tara:strand:- start:138 stop:1106 length:969 start_codon:yes stop_codon:yes gene_type:complete